LTLIGEVEPDGKPRVDLPAGIHRDPVEEEVPAPSPPGEPPEDLVQFLTGARARIEAAGSHFMDDQEVQTYIDELRGEEDRIGAIDREINAAKRRRTAR
jgi:hypothetical protein